MEKFLNRIQDFLYKIWFRYFHKAESSPIKRFKITDTFLDKTEIIQLLKDLNVKIIKEGIVFDSIIDSEKGKELTITIEDDDKLHGIVGEIFEYYPLIIYLSKEGKFIKSSFKDECSMHPFNWKYDFSNMIVPCNIPFVNTVSTHITNDNSEVYFFVTIYSEWIDYRGYSLFNKTIGSVPIKSLIKAGFDIIYE